MVHHYSTQTGGQKTVTLDNMTVFIVTLLHTVHHYSTLTQTGGQKTKMIFAVLDVLLIMGETDKVFFTLIFAVFVEKLYQIWLIVSFCGEDMTKITNQYGRCRHVEFTSGLHFDTFSRLGRQNASAYQIS